MGTEQPSTKSEVQKKFYEHFHAEANALQQQIDRLASTDLVGAERIDATEHSLAAVARLSNEVNEAVPNLPAHDQRTYADSVKALKTRLDDVRATIQPKPKFSFKSRQKNSSAISLADAAELEKKKSLQIHHDYPPTSSTTTSRSDTPKGEDDTDEADLEQYPALKDMAQSAAVRKPSFSQARAIKIANHSSLHIILPSSASHATTSGNLSRLTHCIVDMSMPTKYGKPFAGLSLKQIQQSLLVCGQVSGPVHVTGLQSTILVVSSRQLRMHDCHNCDIYLQCSSKPIIEHCQGIRFAPLPSCYLQATATFEDKWDQVEDFNWLKSEPNPNWLKLPESLRVDQRVWTEMVPGDPSHGLDDILRAVGVID